jgi:hypothetical protein
VGRGQEEWFLSPRRSDNIDGFGENVDRVETHHLAEHEDSLPVGKCRQDAADIEKSRRIAALAWKEGMLPRGSAIRVVIGAYREPEIV